MIPNLATLQLLQPMTPRVVLEAPQPGARGYADCATVSAALEKMARGTVLTPFERNAVVACLLWARDVFACPLERTFTGLGAVDVDGRVVCQLGSRTFVDGDTTLRAANQATNQANNPDNIVADFAVISGAERRRAFDRCGLALHAVCCAPCSGMPERAIIAVNPGYGPDNDLESVAAVVAVERERAGRYADGARTGVLPTAQPTAQPARLPAGLPTASEIVLAAEDRWRDATARDRVLGGVLGAGLLALGGATVYFGAKALKGGE